MVTAREEHHLIGILTIESRRVLCELVPLVNVMG